MAQAPINTAKQTHAPRNAAEAYRRSSYQGNVASACRSVRPSHATAASTTSLSWRSAACSARPDRAAASCTATQRFFQFDCDPDLTLHKVRSGSQSGHGAVAHSP